MNIKYRLFNPFEVDVIWYKASPWIMQALMETRYRFPQELHQDLMFIKNQLLCGNLMLWASLNAAENDFDLVLVTEPSMYGGRKILTLKWMSGKADDKLIDLGILEAWAKANDFYAVHVNGRKGWEKRLRPHGYVHEYTTLSHVLEGAH